MTDPARSVLRRSVLKALILAAAGCGGGEPDVIQSKGNKFDRMKGADKKPQALQDSKKK